MLLKLVINNYLAIATSYGVTSLHFLHTNDVTMNDKAN